MLTLIGYGLAILFIAGGLSLATSGENPRAALLSIAAGAALAFATHITLHFFP